MLILQVLETHEHTGREQPDKEVQIEEESRPGGRLVLGDGCNDRNVNLGIASIPQRVETTTPGGNHACDGEENETSKPKTKGEQDHRSEKLLELLAGQVCSDKFSKRNELNQAEDTKGRHVVTVADRQETNEWNLHTAQRSESIPSGIADVEAGAITTHAKQNEDMERNEVSDKDISTPSRNHVSIEQCSQCPPHNRSILDGLDPQEEGEDKQENGNGLIIVTSSHGTGDITGSNSHECSCKKTRGWRVGHLTSQEVHGQGSQPRKAGGKKDTNVSNIDGDREESEDMVNHTTGNHQTGI